MKETHLLSERALSRHEVFLRTNHPYSGIIATKMPNPPYRATSPEEKERLRSIVSVTSKLGKECETAVIGSWSGTLQSKFDSEKIIDAIQQVTQRLYRVRTKTFEHSELAAIYQALTKPPEIPFIGDERTTPSFEPLEYLFAETERVYGTPFYNMFHEIGKTIKGEISPKIRYLVEASLILAKVGTEKAPSIIENNQLIPNVLIYGKEGKEITQFDGILVTNDSKLKTPDFNFENMLETSPWAVIQIKVPFRARFVSGPKKLSKPIPRDVAELQNQIGRIIIERGNVRLPNFAILAYLRGTLPHAIHIIRFDSRFIDRWIGGLEKKLKHHFFINPNGEGERLIEMLQESKKHTEGIERTKHDRRKQEQPDSYEPQLVYQHDLV